MDAYELAGSLFGTRRMEGSSSMRDYDTTIFGEAVSDSENGTVLVKLSDDVTTPDGSGDAYVELPTYVSVRSGDTVSVGVSTNGTIGDPRVRGVIGGGDRMQAQVDSAETLATQAEAVATATGQHFWHDASGAHVTEAAREDWEADQTGPNSLWNSLGMLFRDGLTNLLAVLTNGLAIYDGAGNAQGNIVAQFTGNEIDLMYDRMSLTVGSGYIGETAAFLASPDTVVLGAGARDPNSGISLGYNPGIELMDNTGTISFISDHMFALSGDVTFSDSVRLSSDTFTVQQIINAIANASAADTWVGVSASDWLSLSSGWSIQDSTLTYNALRKRFVGYLQVRCTSSKTAGNNSLGTVKSGYRPPARIIINTTTNGAYKIYVDGSGAATIVLGSAATANTDFWFAMDYPVS